jgi:hypothetical protein
MVYIPKNRIQSNLYTAGGEYLLEKDNSEYIGYYYKLYDGKVYTGKNPDDKPNFSLIPFTPILTREIFGELFPQNYIYISKGDIDVVNYLNIKNISPDSTLNSPQLYLTIPTEQDYKLGEFQRYFCKKNNEFSYLEISKSDYDKLVKKDPTIDFTSWFPFNIPWSLTGDKDKVGQTNKNIVLLQINKDKLYGFDKYLKGDYLKYYKA